MGKVEDIYESALSRAAELPKRVHVVADARHLASLEQIRADIVATEVALDAKLPSAQIVGASVVVIEVDPASRNSLERIDKLRTEMPHVPVIAGLADVDIATTRQLLRRGVSDIVALPFAMDELVTAIVDAAQNAQPAPETTVTTAPFITVLKSIGGAGSTTLATHLAADMAEAMGDGARACVIDLDLQTGDAGAFLGCSPRMTLGDLIEADGRLDEELLHAVACEGHPRVDVVSAPTDILPIESLEFDTLMQIIKLAQREYDLVIVDLPASFTNWSLSTVFAADMTLMVGTLTIPSLRHAKRQLDFLVSMGIDRRSIHIVLNRVEKKLFKTISVNDAADALKHPVLATVVEDNNLPRTAQDQGLLVDDVQKRSKFMKDINSLSDQLMAQLAEDK